MTSESFFPRNEWKFSSELFDARNGCANEMGAWDFFHSSVGNPPCARNASFQVSEGILDKGGVADFIFMAEGIFF